jgi:hypothetical protein
LAYPFLPDVPAERLKCSCSLVEPGLHLADLLELWVMTPLPLPLLTCLAVTVDPFFSSSFLSTVALARTIC